MCHVSCVMFHMSHVTCYLPCLAYIIRYVCYDCVYVGASRGKEEGMTYGDAATEGLVMDKVVLHCTKNM